MPNETTLSDSAVTGYIRGFASSCVPLILAWSAAASANTSATAPVLTAVTSQPSNGMTNSGITMEEVGRWASILNAQGVQQAKRACTDNDGTVATCSKIEGDVTHRVVHTAEGKNIGVIEFKMRMGEKIISPTAVRIVTLVGANVVTVSCTGTAPGVPDNPAMASACLTEVRRVLGVDLRL
jgi:hypothetical protein